jgi:alanine racemase
MTPVSSESRAGAILGINLGAIVANWRLLAARAAPAACAAVVKANAYGLGAGPVAKALLAAGCRIFFVATLDEGMALRAALGPESEIAVFNGPLPGSEREYPAHGLTPVLNDLGQVAAWRRMNAPAMLHIDTGMSRLGLPPRELAVLTGDPTLWQPIPLTGVVSHLACADTPDHGLNTTQLARFTMAKAHFPGLRASLSASSGIFLGHDYHHDLVRPGAALYGVNPCPESVNPMRQVVTLKGKILQVREIDSGESVGYGAAYIMPGAGRLAIVAAGYADGWLRAMSHRGSGIIAGQRAPLVGRVSMDLITFDVSAIDPALVRPGDSVELLGASYGVDEAAADAGTIGYEILTSLGSRYHRIYHPAEPG